MTTLKDLYYNPQTGFSGVNKLYERARRDGMQVKKKDVINFLNGEDVYQRFTKKEPFNSFVANEPLQEFQIDLIIMKDISNVDYTYCLTCIDVCTRVADAEPMRDKTAGEALQAFKTIVERMGKPKQIYADSGKEWLGQFGKYLDEQRIKAIFVTTHAPFIERFNQTLKNMIHRYMTEKGTDKWRVILPEIIDNYNSSYHSSIKMSPNDAKQNPIDAVVNTLKRANFNKRERLKVGDVVRLAKTKNIFTKGYLPSYSAKQHKVLKIEDGMYYLDGQELPVPRSQIKKFTDVQGVKEREEESDVEYDVLPDPEELSAPRYKAERRRRKEGIDMANIIEDKRRRVKFV